MFQFTREFIINKDEGKINRLNTGGATAKSDAKFAGKDSVFMVDRICNLKAANIVNAFKTAGSEAVLEEVKVNLDGTSMTSGKTARLELVLGQEGRVISTYNDYYPEHTRTFLYEITTTGTEAGDAAAFAKVIEKEIQMSEGVYFSIDYTNSNEYFIIKATDEFTRVLEVKLVLVPDQATYNTVPGNVLTGYKDYTVKFDAVRNNASFKEGTSTSTVVTFNGSPAKVGKLGIGTTNYLIHNVRLLTAANITPYGINMDERPLPDSVYDQYLIEYVTERRHIGGQVFGSIDHSLTSYVFFVLHSLASEFDKALANAGITVSDSTSTGAGLEQPLMPNKASVAAAAGAVLPSTTAASAGQVLKLDADKNPIWAADATE